ncbi:hypothetical protein H8959_008222 [Pygathrix nigripes]
MLGGPGPWKDASEFDERDHEATGLSPSLASWAPPPYFILGPPISVSRILGQAHLLRMWSVCVHAWGCVGTAGVRQGVESRGIRLKSSLSHFPHLLSGQAEAFTDMGASPQNVPSRASPSACGPHSLGLMGFCHTRRRE